MRTSVACLFTVSLALVLARPGEAQSTRGNREFGFAAAFFDLTEDEDPSLLILSLEYGHFLTDAIEVGGGLLMGGPLDDVDEDVEVVAFVQYHFTPEKTTTWYVLAGYVASFEELDVGFAGGGFGFKAYWRENVAFSWELDYGISITSAVDGGAVQSIAGLSYVF